MDSELANLRLALESTVLMLLRTGMIAIPALWLLKRLFYGRQK
jgi:hypothetical protein